MLIKQLSIFLENKKGRFTEVANVLRDHLYAVSVADVVCLHCPNQPGALAKAMQIITSAGIFVEYMYAFSQGDAANVIIRPDNVERCAEVLKENKLELIAASDLYKL